MFIVGSGSTLAGEHVSSKPPFEFPKMPDISASPIFKAMEQAAEAIKQRPLLVANAGILNRPPVSRIPHEAESLRERLVLQIVEFERSLDLDHEVGLHLVQAGTMTVIHVERVGFHGPDMIIFEGRDSDGNRVRILQHVSQVSVELKALPKLSETPIRIGFLAT